MSTGYALDAMRAADWPQVRAIYLEGIDAGNATFETDAPDWDAWDAAHLPMLPAGSAPGRCRHRVGGVEPGVPPPRLCRRGRGQRVCRRGRLRAWASVARCSPG